MPVRKIEEADFGAFKEMFCAYFEELDCEDDPLHLFEEYVLPDLKAGLFSVAVAENGKTLCGFVIWQIDDVINDWCFKDGWGDVRELYVLPDMRGRGTGSALLQFALQALKAEGAQSVYTLPAEESEGFFIKCGFEDCAEYCADTDNKVFSKILS